MMQNNMMFGSEGPIMQGNWYNPHTGDAFTVHDSFFEDNQYVVTTTDGRYLRYDQIQNYVQTDTKLEDLKKLKVENPVKEDLPAEVANLIEAIDSNDPYFGMMHPDDLMIGNTKPVSLGNLSDNRNNHYIKESPIKEMPIKQQSMNEVIIEKALKNAPKPEIKVDISWDVYPEKQIEMLKDVMDIPEDEIIDWYLDNIDMLELVNALKLAIKDKILCKESSNLTVDKFIKYANFDGSYENAPGSATPNDKQNKKTTKSSSTNKVKTIKSRQTNN
jgi:hypothetical protein